MTVRSSAVVLIAAGVMLAAAAWYYRSTEAPPDTVELSDGAWLEHLYSRNPKVAEAAAAQLEELGVEALPELRAVLQDPSASLSMRKAALKAAGLLGPDAAPLIPDVAQHLPDPALTEEAAVALSFMGGEAFAPLETALESDDPVVRREALRSLGKLRERAPVEPRAVVPLLLEGLADPDADVRVVAATYLGILADDAGSAAVRALIETLRDEDPDVRAAAATALGSFGEAGAVAISALRKAAADRDEEVAREAGLALVKLQSSSRR